MELSAYISLFRRWLWLIVLAAVLGGGLNYLLQRRAVTLYAATSQVLVGRYVDDPDPTSGEIRLAQDLLLIYIQVLQRADVLQEVITNLQLEMSIEELRSMIAAAPVGGTSLLAIQVIDADPQRAIRIANELANQLITHSPSTLTPEQEARIELASDQIAEMSLLQDNIQSQIDAVDAAILTSTDANEIPLLSERRSILLTQYAEISANIATFSSVITALEDPLNAIQIFEPASSVVIVQQPNALSAVIVGAVAVVVLVIAVLLLMQYLNDTIYTSEQAQEVLGIPPMGVISRHGHRFGRSNGRNLITNYGSDPLLLEEFRTLRANLVTALSNRQIQLLVVTSTYQREGKSWITANLAVALALAGHHVCLVDADMRNPTMHKFFNVNANSQIGLAHALGGQQTTAGIKHVLPINLELEYSLVWTAIPDLWMVTSGFNALNANEILGSQAMHKLVDWLTKTKRFDFVLFDTPPMLPVTDSIVLSSTVDAAVLFVVRSGMVSEEAAATMVSRLQMNRVNPIYFILNQGQPQAKLYRARPNLFDWS